MQHFAQIAGPHSVRLSYGLSMPAILSSIPMDLTDHHDGIMHHLSPCNKDYSVSDMYCTPYNLLSSAGFLP